MEEDELTDEQMIAQYQRWVAKKCRFGIDDDELDLISHMRAQLHQSFAGSQKKQSLIREIREIDVNWQNFLIKNNSNGYEFSYRIDAPKSHWWEWLDKLNELTDEERSTL